MFWKKKKMTFEDAQKYLRKFFIEAGEEEGKKMWDVLTALRGPDDGDYGLKEATTAIIRTRFLGYPYLFYVPAQFATADWNPKVREAAVGSCHFLKHAQRAFSTLGLKWDEANAEIDPQ